MHSEDSKRIIKIIAEEEGMSEWAVKQIVSSQFEGANRIMASGKPDDPETFKNIVINAFGAFNIIPWRFKRFKGRVEYEKEKQRRYDNKK